MLSMSCPCSQAYSAVSDHVADAATTGLVAAVRVDHGACICIHRICSAGELVHGTYGWCETSHVPLEDMFCNCLIRAHSSACCAVPC